MARTPPGWDTYSESRLVFISQDGYGVHDALTPDQARAFAARLVELAAYAEADDTEGAAS